jgi:low affinity Fe/Cu permease
MSQASALVDRGDKTNLRPPGPAQAEQQPQPQPQSQPQLGGVARKFNEGFRRCASAAANAVGSKWAFLLSCVVVLGWAATGPMFRYSDTWQLVINTGTTIVTFLMVFLIQNTQNRDAKAIHLKLDELIRSVKGARNHLVNLEEFTDEELANLQKQFEQVRRHATEKVMKRADQADQKAEEAGRKADDAHERADVAHQKADVAHGVSAKAEDTAEDAHDAARAARAAAEEARERARRAEERAASLNR